VAVHFRKRDYTLFEAHEEFGGQVTSDEGRMVGNNAVDAFTKGTFDEVNVIYSSFVSTMTQRPVEKPLLPIAPEDTGVGEDAEAAVAGPDYIWEPSQEAMFAVLLPLYLRNRVFMTLAESFTSEHAARMTSMSAATQNAGEMIEALTLQRNRERQAAITSELLDIVGGANAL
jgi:F-type H+-transporting ATPase subunit gamma